MMTYSEFEDELYNAAENIPDKYFVDLNGGISARRQCKFHPMSRGGELCIMGQYIQAPHLGRMIVLYYGSFLHHYRYREREFWEDEIRRVLEHELTHHLEHLAGENDLDIEDAVKLREYLMKNKEDMTDRMVDKDG